MKTLLALLMLTTAAQGQTVPAITLSATGGCTLGHTAFTSNEDHCRKAGGKFYPQTYMTVGQSPITAMGSSNVTVSANPRPACEDGWTLVDAGRPMCAQELREPK